MIGSIEIIYKGYRFRSRLEARWAVFFDELKIDYLYEPEGYVLHDDSKYLPDFFLPNVRGGMWIEVKPVGFSEGKIAEKKLEMLCSVTDKPGMIVAGDPIVNIDFAESGVSSNSEYYPAWWIFLRQDFEGGSGDYAICDGPYIFCLCPWCGKVGIEFDGRGARVCGYREHFNDEEAALSAIKHLGHWRADDKCYTGNHPLINLAATKARQARFEHGEHGAS